METHHTPMEEIETAIRYLNNAESFLNYAARLLLNDDGVFVRLDPEKDSGAIELLMAEINQRWGRADNIAHPFEMYDSPRNIIGDLGAVQRAVDLCNLDESLRRYHLSYIFSIRDFKYFLRWHDYFLREKRGAVVLDLSIIYEQPLFYEAVWVVYLLIREFLTHLYSESIKFGFLPETLTDNSKLLTALRGIIAEQTRTTKPQGVMSYLIGSESVKEHNYGIIASELGEKKRAGRLIALIMLALEKKGAIINLDGKRSAFYNALRAKFGKEKIASDEAINKYYNPNRDDATTPISDYEITKFAEKLKGLKKKEL